MKKLFCSLCIVVVFPGLSYAAQPKQLCNNVQVKQPYYLTVTGWKKCVVTKKVADYQIWCLPAKKPANCSQTAWTDLVKNSDMLRCSK